jgi:hypothetical protein
VPGRCGGCRSPSGRRSRSPSGCWPTRVRRCSGSPGNPVSAMVSFELFVRPALRRLEGHRSCTGRSSPPPPKSTCIGSPTASSTSCGRTSTSTPPASWRVRTTGGQESHQLHAMSEANSLILLPDGDGRTRRRAGRRPPHRPRSAQPRYFTRPAGPPSQTGGVVTAPVPVAISVKTSPRSAGRCGGAGAGHAARGTAGRPLREGAQRSPHFGDRSLQPALRLLHARRGLSFLPKNELLTFDEITRLARVAKSLGVTALRITGRRTAGAQGAALARRRLSALGFDDLAMTTNGTELAPVAGELAAAGLRRVNVSCDSLRPDRFAAIRRRGQPRCRSRRDGRSRKCRLDSPQGQRGTPAGPERRRDPRLRLLRPADRPHRALHRVHAAGRARKVGSEPARSRPRGVRAHLGRLASRAALGAPGRGTGGTIPLRRRNR